jgi:hypothetical protein
MLPVRKPPCTRVFWVSNEVADDPEYEVVKEYQSRLSEIATSESSRSGEAKPPPLIAFSGLKRKEQTYPGRSAVPDKKIRSFYGTLADEDPSLRLSKNAQGAALLADRTGGTYLKAGFGTCGACFEVLTFELIGRSNMMLS